MREFMASMDPARFTQGQLGSLLDDIIVKGFGGAGPKAKCGLILDHPRLKWGSAAWIPFTRKEDMSTARILEFLDRLLQSNQDCPIGEFSIKCTVVEPVRAGARPRVLNVDHYLAGHAKTILAIQNTDQRCITRAIACGLAYCHRGESQRLKEKWKTIREGDKRR